MSDSMTKDMFSAISKVTKQWKTEKKKADKDDRLSSKQYACFYKPARITIKEVAYEVMEEAYKKASSNGKYYANARQIFYAARPYILKQTDKSRLDSQYFTQTLLKDYIEDYAPNWKIAWDARGHFREPHTNKAIGIGGIQVEKYIHSWRNDSSFIYKETPGVKIKTDTIGPFCRFNSVLFIEKEGFDEILKDAKIGEKYDLAIMSTKGIPVKACCDLLCSLESMVNIYVLHDFDKSGFTILKTLREGTRLARGAKVIDLGLRFEDIQDLPREPVYERGEENRYYLHKCGATEEEIAILARDNGYRGCAGERVELNAMMSEELIEWLEGKLEKHGVKKTIPEESILIEAYNRAYFAKEMESFIEEKENEFDEKREDTIPEDLLEQVRADLKEYPSHSWDEAVWNIAENEFDSDTD